MNHTPGPWTAEEIRHNYDRVIRNAHRDPVALVVIAGYGQETGKANANLIAAAPDLLDVAYSILPCVEQLMQDAGYKPVSIKALITKVRAAIAKAEGRS